MGIEEGAEHRREKRLGGSRRGVWGGREQGSRAARAGNAEGRRLAKEVKEGSKRKKVGRGSGTRG